MPTEDSSFAPSRLPASDVYKTVPLSFQQQQMWHVCHFQCGTVAYNQPVAWRLHGSLDIRALEQALSGIIDRHEALRTNFSIVDGIPAQIIHRESRFALRVVDLRVYSEDDRERHAQEGILEESCYSFDLGADLLLRSALFQLADESYIFILTVHHIVCDGWSMGILLRELAPLYRSFVTGCALTLPAIEWQYSDFVDWQREPQQLQKLDEQLKYWKEQLRDASVAEISANHTRPAIASFRGASGAFTLPKDLTVAFKSLCARESVFLFMGLTAILQSLLYRYSGQTDILIGAPVASRKRGRLQGSIGLFLNLIALRTKFSNDITFRQLLKQVCSIVMGAYQHQDVPFERVVEAVRPARSPGRSPLFQVTLDQVDPKWIALDLERVRADWFPVDNQTAKFDLTLAWSDSPEGLRGWLEYNTDRFDESTISRLHSHFRALIESAIANPDQSISRLALLTEPERQQLLIDWNQTQADYPAGKCIHELFELQAQRTPQAIAVETASEQIVYSELNRKANQLAHHLRRSGVGRESLIGVCLGRGINLIAALLAILKTGAAYVTLDPAYPPQRLAFMLQDSGAKTVLTEERFVARLPNTEAKVICLDLEQENLARENGQDLAIPASADSAAYVIYTSGSTGQPKGILGLHRGAVNRFAWMWKAYPFGSGEVACAKTSLNFVDSIWELFGPLLAGIKTVLIADEIAKSPKDLIAALAVHRVSRLVLVPSLLRAMLQVEPEIGKRLPTLHYWITSGEALPPDLVLRFRKSAPDRVLLNLYGSSEVSADVTCYDTSEMPNSGPVLIGKPIANTQTYILDANLEPVAIGVTAQLCVSGAGLARGYLNQSLQSAENFVRHPFHSDPSQRLYLTGDLARYRPDGNIELLGRIDHQVKIRGVRIEPGEIEAAIGRHSSIMQAVVVTKVGSTGEPLLVAYVVFSKNEQLSAQQLRHYLRERLQEQMVPSEFIFLNELPILPNGKTDRNRLLGADFASPRRNELAAEPSSLTESRILGIWREVLKTQPIGMHDNFFDLGGHSLLLATVQTKLSQAFDREIASVDLYRYPTINSLARHLGEFDLEQRPLNSIRQRADKQLDARLRRRRVAARTE
jgi:amino acid adenylation domain-containing protein